MDSTKSNVVKSKSSTSKSAAGSNKNKKSWSNAEFQRQALKKRGVYVEKKTTKLDINQDDGRDSSPPATLQEQPIRDATDSSPQRPKPPPRPKRGQKIFLTSVLSILDKDTIGTQCPDFKEPKKLKRPSRKRRSPNKNDVAVHTSTQQVEAIERKKPKYRSKVLTSEINNKDEKLYILSPKRDITSTNSERSYDSKKYLDLPKAKEEVRGIAKHIHSDVAERTAKEVVEGSKAKKRVIRIDEPKTLVEERQEDRGLYNFFVDLLETTFSVYNVHPDYKTSEQFDPKMEIDETVAEKLQIIKERTPERGQYYFVEDRGILWKSKLSENQRPTSSRMKEANARPPVKPTKRPQSAPFYPQFRTEAPKPQKAAVTPKKYKKKRKQDLLSILKEQLMKDISPEEPQDMHQALKMIAQNKRRIRQSIRFDETATKSDDYHVCRFKRRNVISTSMKSKAKNKPTTRASPKNTPRHSAMRRNLKIEYSTSEESVKYETESHHSLEVQEFDECFTEKHIPNPETEHAYHNAKESEDGFPLLKFTNSLDSSKNYCSAYSDSLEENMDTTSVCMPWDDNKNPYCASIDLSNMSTF